jgi:hypothetical protein
MAALTASCAESSSQEVESLADDHVATMKASLDVTTLEQFTAQMPASLQPESSRRGSNRVFVWTFRDGSQIEATFRPRGGENSGQGLVLYSVDVRDQAPK